jgi:hypothetical protein
VQSSLFLSLFCGSTLSPPSKARAVHSAAGAASPEKIRLLLRNTRWVLVASDPVNADALACSLRELNAHVRLIDPAGLALSRLGSFDAQLLFSDRGQDLRFLRERVLAHPVLRWTSQVSMPWSELWEPGNTAPLLGKLVQVAVPALDPDRELLKTLRSGNLRFEARLDGLGPVRALRLLCEERDIFRVHLNGAHERGGVEIAGDLIVGAYFELSGFPPLTGVQAFARVLELACQRMTVERRVRLEAPSLSMPFEQALELAVCDIRERDGSDSPTLRMASPLALLTPGGVTSEEANELITGLEIDVQETADAPWDSGVIARQQQQALLDARGRTLLAHDDTVDARLRPSTTDSLRPTVVTMGMRAKGMSFRLQWVALVLMAAFVTAGAMLAAERMWRLESSSDQKRHVESHATRRENRANAQQPSVASASATERANKRPEPRPAPREPAPARHERPSEPAAVAQSDDSDTDTDDPYEVERTARAALSRSDGQAALRLTERLVALRPKRARYRVLYGDALAMNGQTQAAMSQYQIAYEHAPKSHMVKSRMQRLGVH